MIYIIILLLLIIGFLGFKLFKKQEIDRQEIIYYHKELEKRKQALLEMTYEINLAQEGMPPNSYMRFEVGNSLMEGSFPFILERDDTLPNV